MPPPLTGREKITNQFDGMTHDYTHKGGVVHTEILLPDHAPAEYADKTVLWNEVEKIEKLAERRKREYRAAISYRLRSRYTVTQGTGGKTGIFPIAV